MKVCILGCGKTGLAAIKYFTHKGDIVFLYDDNKVLLETLCNESNIKVLSEMMLFEMDLLFVSPGIPNNSINRHPIINQAIQYNIKIISDIELLQNEYPNAKYIGITGTNGKSTTTALIGHILNHTTKQSIAVCGNIGTPVLSVGKADIYVIELSSFQLDLLPKINLDVAICLNIMPDHMNCYIDLNEYTASKASIFNNAYYQIISVDYVSCYNIYTKLNHAIPLSRKILLDGGISVLDSKIYIQNCFSITGIYPLKSSLLGQYNDENIAAAIATCLAIGISIESIIDAISSFKGLSHRMELILEVNTLTFINDSKATNNNATLAALDALQDKNIIWIAGGLCKDDGIEYLKNYFKSIQAAYLIGSSMEAFADTLARYNVKAYKVETLENALNSIKDSSPNNCTILLSPACASTDQWKSFEERGDFFKSKVKDLFR